MKWDQHTRALSFRDGGYEAHEASAAEKLGHEDSGMALGIGTFNPLKAWTEYTGLAATFTQDTATIATHFQTIPSSSNFARVPKTVHTLA